MEGNQSIGEIQNDTFCRNAIYSEEYLDYIYENISSEEEVMRQSGAACVQQVDLNTWVSYVPSANGTVQYPGPYQRIPNLYGLMDTAAVEAMSVLRVRRQPFLDVLGRGVLIGIVDTGIDYTHPVFQSADGRSRIASIWDQTVKVGENQEGGENPPDGFLYGAYYTKERITQALQSENPLSVVPETDEIGHGTFLAGVAAGNIMEADDFTGVAPLSELVVVKLKEAKNSLKDYYCVARDKNAYSSADLMLGVRFLLEEARRLNRPIVILVGLGSSNGRHCGCLPFPRYLSREAVKTGRAIVVSGGNEGNIGHHYEGRNLAVGEVREFELKVEERESGLSFEVWIDPPGLGSIELVSPLGEDTGKIPFNFEETQEVRFPLERTKLYFGYNLIEPNARSELIFVRMLEPTPGIWRIRIHNEVDFATSFNTWLPIREFVEEGTYFLQSEPDVTICEPGNASLVMTITAYDSYSGSLYFQASRGYARNDVIKPDFAAPGVNVYGPARRGQYGRMTGTSVAAALAAGGAAMMLEWGIVQGNSPEMQTVQISNMFMRSARRKNIVYPNREWGYGEIDLYNTFAQIRF